MNAAALFPPTEFALLAVVLGLPLLGALVCGLFGARLGKPGVRLMALSAVGGSFLASVVTFLALAAQPAGGRLVWTAWRWMTIDGRGPRTLNLDVAFSVDALSATMMLVVTGVGFLIHLYATGYMAKDRSFPRFFAYLNLFIFSMLVLILGDNLPMLFVGWEGVGLCSYLLIGFWFTEERNAAAGQKAFLVNRIGDFGLLVAMAALVYHVGALDFAGLAAGSRALTTEIQLWPSLDLPGWLRFANDVSPVTVRAATLVGLALFLGCVGKSAQIPLFVWLPDAMAGPTPVSALIHAATMVTAGVYLVCRMSFVFLLSPVTMAVIAVTGVVTALLAASIGLVQNDLKKVLAYSTVSQLGFMFLGVGVGAYAAGFFHVLTHAFFKACLFLGAGSVIHAMHARIHDTDASQDMRHMGGLRRYMPITYWTFVAACVAITGLPGTSGFFSKDEILWKAFSTEVPGWPAWLGPALYAAGIVAATMTSFYMFRALFLTFFGEFRGWRVVKGFSAKGSSHGHHAAPGRSLRGPEPHESPASMTLPLVVLAALSLGGGFLMAEPIHVAPLAHWLDPVFSHAAAVVKPRAGVEGLLWPMMAPGVLAFAAGLGAAHVFYVQRAGRPAAALAGAAPGLYRLLRDRWRVDELYDRTAVAFVDALADTASVFDRWIVDGVLARLSAAVVAAAGTVLRAFQTGRVQAYAASMVVGLVAVAVHVASPHAALTVEEKREQAGTYVVNAAPGLGYRYRFAVDGDGKPAPPPRADGFTAGGQLEVKLEPGETKKVRLDVRNALLREASTEVTLTRPASARPRAAGASAPTGAAAPAGGTR